MFERPPKGPLDLSIRIAVVLVYLALGAIIPTALHAAGQFGTSFPDVFPEMCLAGAIATGAIVLVKRAVKSGFAQIGLGCLGAYGSLVLSLLIIAAISGRQDFAETATDLPMILLFGIPYMSPVVFMAFVAANTFLGWDSMLPKDSETQAQQEPKESS